MGLFISVKTSYTPPDMKILVFGDIVNNIGVRAVKTVLPRLIDTHRPDLVIANAENLAGGKGITPEILQDLLHAGVDFFTSGNHVFAKKQAFDVFSDAKLSEKIIRPANYPAGVPGVGAKMLSVGAKNVLVINLLGRVHGPVLCDDPFRRLDEILKEFAHQRPSVILVDFHAEATSEKVAFGWHCDGRTTAMWGTHTHVPTRDERVLPGGTAYITDVGMTGMRDGVIGVDKEAILRNFTTSLPVKHEYADSGDAIVNALLIDTDGLGKASSITHYQEIVHI